MRIGIRKLNTRGLTKAVTRLSRLTGESKAELANESAKFVALHAFRQTDRTTAAAIRQELEEKRGPYTKAEMILAHNYRASGNWPKGRYAVRRESKKFISRKAQTANWLRTGFLPAIQLFGGRAAAMKKFRNRPGAAEKARKSFTRPRAVIEHFDEGFVQRHPRLLQEAVDRQTRFVERIAQKKMQRNIRRSRTS